MNQKFAEKMSALRRERGLPQRKVAADLGISQALLSHYENGVREPGLDFVCRVCDYYNVTADYIIGRTGNTENGQSLKELISLAAELRSLTERTEDKLQNLQREY